MLSSFTIRRTFNRLGLSLYVDCDRREATLSVTYERYLRGMQSVPFHTVATPELAEKMLSAPSGIYGNVVETLEHTLRATHPAWLQERATAAQEG